MVQNKYNKNKRRRYVRKTDNGAASNKSVDAETNDEIQPEAEISDNETEPVEQIEETEPAYETSDEVRSEEDTIEQTEQPEQVENELEKPDNEQ